MTAYLHNYRELLCTQFMNMKKSLLTFLDCFFASKISLKKRIFFLIMLAIMALISFRDVVNRDFFDSWSDSQIISPIYAHSNDLDVNYIPFQTPVIVFTIPANVYPHALLFTSPSFTYDQLPDNDSDYIHYYSHYIGSAHLGAIMMRTLNIKNFKTMKIILYAFSLALSLGVFSLFLLLLFNKTGNILPPIFAVIAWGGVKTDLSLWFNFGLKMLPIAIITFVTYKISNIQNHTKRWLILFPTSFIAFFILCLHTYDIMPATATAMLAIHFYIINEKKINYRLWLPEAFIIGLGIIASLAVTVFLHLQLIDTSELIYRITKRTVFSTRVPAYAPPDYLNLLSFLMPQLILLALLPLLAIYFWIKGNSRLVAILAVFASLSGLILWCVAFPYVIDHVHQTRQSLYYFLLPMILIIFNRNDIRIKFENYITSMFRKI